MIHGTTESGFEFELDESVLDDMRLIDAIAELQDGADVFAVSKIVRILIGEAGREALYRHIENEKGHVPVSKVSKEIVDIFEACGKRGKNS